MFPELFHNQDCVSQESWSLPLTSPGKDCSPFLCLVKHCQLFWSQCCQWSQGNFYKMLLRDVSNTAEVNEVNSFSHKILKQKKFQGFSQWYEVTYYAVSTKQFKTKNGRYEFWRALKGLVFKGEKTLYQTFFLQPLQSFEEGRNEHGVCLPNALGERPRQANGRANPGFLREEQRSGKLILEKRNLKKKKRTGHSLSGCFPPVLYGVSWLCHIPCILYTGAKYCCQQCHLVTVQLKATCWRTSRRWIPALKKTGIFLKPLMSDVI